MANNKTIDNKTIECLGTIDRFHSRDQFFDFRYYAAILVYLNGKKMLASFVWNMVLCLIVGFGSKNLMG